jgi:hypothetical protein
MNHFVSESVENELCALRLGEQVRSNLDRRGIFRRPLPTPRDESTRARAKARVPPKQWLIEKTVEMLAVDPLKAKLQGTRIPKTF